MLISDVNAYIKAGAIAYKNNKLNADSMNTMKDCIGFAYNKLSPPLNSSNLISQPFGFPFFIILHIQVTKRFMSRVCNRYIPINVEITTKIDIPNNCVFVI